jgi:hypothetical protein
VMSTFLLSRSQLLNTFHGHTRTFLFLQAYSKMSSNCSRRSLQPVCTRDPMHLIDCIGSVSRKRAVLFDLCTTSSPSMPSPSRIQVSHLSPIRSLSPWQADPATPFSTSSSDMTIARLTSPCAISPLSSPLLALCD